mmetsp:Transcript_19851/g.39924  ORF Transcript_19851/g.39924 Transcript_19851/m.39924 type:complete len:127 (+) Transcript_19851:1430-1810(+)
MLKGSVGDHWGEGTAVCVPRWEERERTQTIIQIDYLYSLAGRCIDQFGFPFLLFGCAVFVCMSALSISPGEGDECARKGEGREGSGKLGVGLQGLHWTATSAQASQKRDAERDPSSFYFLHVADSS